MFNNTKDFVSVDRFLLWLLVARCACAERWSWPDADPADSVGDESVRIDSKVRFIDSDSQQKNSKRYSITTLTNNNVRS